jgi:hypothetical protein
VIQKFIVNSDIELYSSHGPLPAFQIYQAFIAKSLKPDFKLAGFGPQGKELSGTIKNIIELSCPTGYLMKVSGVGVQSNSLIFYPGQAFLDISGKVIPISNVRPSDLLVSLNGMLNVDFVSELEITDEMQTFYVIEFTSPMETIYANNLVIFPMEVGESKNSFFTE